MENPKPRNYICPIHKTPLLEGESSCWRCRTKGVIQLNKEIDSTVLQRKRLGSGELQAIVIKNIPIWIIMN